jgi:membrane-bound serine protease (ClpP class)
MTALIIALLIVGAALLVAEAHVVSYGVLGIAGVAALVAAGVLAVEDAGGSLVLALALAIPVAAGLLAFMFVAGRKTLEVGRRRPRGGTTGLIGRVGVVRRALSPVGAVLVDGELWRARRSWAEEELALGEGEYVVVERLDGLTLSVRRAEEWEVMP